MISVGLKMNRYMYSSSWGYSAGSDTAFLQPRILLSPAMPAPTEPPLTLSIARVDAEDVVFLLLSGAEIFQTNDDDEATVTFVFDEDLTVDFAAYKAKGGRALIFAYPLQLIALLRLSKKFAFSFNLLDAPTVHVDLELDAALAWQLQSEAGAHNFIDEDADNKEVAFLSLEEGCDEPQGKLAVTPQDMGQLPGKSTSHSENRTSKRTDAAPLFVVSPALAIIMGDDPISHSEVVSMMWGYIKKNGLQNGTNKRMIVCDAVLRAAFGKDSFSIFEMANLITSVLTPVR